MLNHPDRRHHEKARDADAADAICDDDLARKQKPMLPKAGRLARSSAVHDQKIARESHAARATVDAPKAMQKIQK